jgi:PmbA protein
MDRTEALVTKAKALGADEAIAKTTFGRKTQIRFSNNEVDVSKVWNDYVTEVSMAWQKRVVATQIQDFVDAEKRVEDLFKLAKVSQPNPFYGGIASGSFTYPKSRADNRLRDLDEPTVYVEEAIEAAGEEVGKDLNTGGTLYSYYGDVYLVSLHQSLLPKGGFRPRSELQLDTRQLRPRLGGEEGWRDRQAV